MTVLLLFARILHFPIQETFFQNQTWSDRSKRFFAVISIAVAVQEMPMSALLGTIYYIAPEVIRGHSCRWSQELLTMLASSDSGLPVASSVRLRIRRGVACSQLLLLVCRNNYVQLSKTSRAKPHYRSGSQATTTTNAIFGVWASLSTCPPVSMVFLGLCLRPGIAPDGVALSK